MSANAGTLARLRDRIKDGFGIKTKETEGSVFTATIMELFIKLLILGFLSVITLFIGFPFFYVNFLKWVYSKTKINGKGITFNGTGGQYFVKNLIWTLLSIVTFGIYAILCVPREYCKFFVENTHFEGETGISEFKGGRIEFLLVLLAANPLTFVFGPPIVLSYIFGNSVIDGKKLSFHLNGLALWAQLTYWGVMGIITLGFYFFLGAPFYRSAIEFVLENISINDNSGKKEEQVERKIELKSGKETINNNTGKTKLIVERGNNFVCSSIPFEIFIDNKKAFSIKNASKFSGFIKNGTHSIHAAIDNNTQSEILKFNTDNPEIKFRVRVLEIGKIKLEKII